MKKYFIAMLLMLSVIANAQVNQIDTIKDVVINTPNLQVLSPRYMSDYVQLGRPGQHWFVGVQGGYSAFIGDPVGCGDFFDRTMPVFNTYLGKWITPGTGIRLAFQGFRYKDSELEKSNYRLLHADIMFNLANVFRKPSNDLPRWDFAPYIGTGLAKGSRIMIGEKTTRNYLFALTYGIYTRLRFGQHFFLSAEMSGMSTFRDFDGYGEHDKLMDIMPSVSIGLGFNLGSPSWRHAIEANSYIDQNNDLLDYVVQLDSYNNELKKQHVNDSKTKNELKKILEIEQLLDKYKYVFEESPDDKNSYHGLLALRARLKEMSQKDSIRRESWPVESNSGSSVIELPVYFYFQLGKARLTDESQLVNLDKLAELAISHNLKIHIIGAADSATGNNYNNTRLSEDRAAYIAEELGKRGVKNEYIQQTSLGGISEFKRPQDNRYTKVSLFLEIKGI